MKKIIFLTASLAIIIAGCKVRQVDRQKTHIKTTADSTGSKKERSGSIDTGKITAETTQKSSESAIAEVDITTDSGQVQHLQVDKNGNINFTGKAKGIKIRTKSLKKDSTASKKQEIKGKSTFHRSTEQSKTHKTTDQEINNKQTRSSIDVGKTAELVCLLVVIAAGIFLAIKFYFRK